MSEYQVGYDEVQQTIENTIAALQRMAGLMSDETSGPKCQQYMQGLETMGNIVDKWLEEIEEEEDKQHAPPVREPRTERRFHDHCAIAPIGLVNLMNGKNANFGTVFRCWEAGRGTCLLVRNVEDRTKYRVVYTSENDAQQSGHTVVGDTLRLQHDQLGYNMGTWEVYGFFPHTPEGHKSIKEMSSKTSLPFATFK